MRRILGEIQRHLMVFGLSNNYVYSTFGLAIGIFSIYQNAISSKININDSKAEILIIIASIFSIIFKFVVETNELKNRNNEFFEIDLCNYRDEVKDVINLSIKYKDSGYHIHEFNNERYVMSDEVNEKIYLNEIKLMLKYSGKFILANEVKQVAPFALNKAFDSKSTIYNSKLIRLADEIFIGTNNDTNNEIIRIQKTDYFQGLCTNEIVYSRLKNLTNISDPFIFEGKKLMLDQNNDLLQLCESHCSNYLGGSTLAITADNFIILNVQSNSSHTNPGRIAPSGSGSTDYRDYKKLKGNGTFQELVSITMERELREECGLRFRGIEMKSKVIGFARLLERGGKPDFFGITYIKCNHTAIRKSIKEVFEIGKYEMLAIPFNEYKEIPDKLYELINADLSKVSIQVYILAGILKNLYDKGIDVYSDLIDN